MRIKPDPYSFKSYDVKVINLGASRLYHLDVLFEDRVGVLNSANNEGQLSPGEKRGLARFLDDGDNSIKFLAE